MRAEQTGEKKVTAEKKEAEGPREEGDGVNGEERDGGGGAGGWGGREATE